jgi:hypothetical protein
VPVLAAGGQPIRRPFAAVEELSLSALLKVEKKDIDGDVKSARNGHPTPFQVNLYCLLVQYRR